MDILCTHASHTGQISHIILMFQYKYSQTDMKSQLFEVPSVIRSCCNSNNLLLVRISRLVNSQAAMAGSVYICVSVYMQHFYAPSCLPAFVQTKQMVELLKGEWKMNTEKRKEKSISVCEREGVTVPWGPGPVPHSWCLSVDHRKIDKVTLHSSGNTNC